ncbi:hypothetical protein V8C40DRAFT_241859 [Trichoderma camerunense]
MGANSRYQWLTRQATLGYLWLEWVVCLSHNDSLASAIIRGPSRLQWPTRVIIATRPALQTRSRGSAPARVPCEQDKRQTDIANDSSSKGNITGYRLWLWGGWAG